MFGAGDTVGTIGTITDGVYNKQWVIYTISGNTYQLFPMQNLTSDSMYEMYKYNSLYNTVLPNLKKSGLNIISCDLVSVAVFNDICSKTGKEKATIAGGEFFWLAGPIPYESPDFYGVNGYGGIYGYAANGILGVRPLITVVK